MIMNLFGIATGLVKESFHTDNRYCAQTQNLMRVKGYELVGKEYREIKTKYMLNEYVKITGHEYIPEGYVTKIRKKVCGCNGITSYIVMYGAGEYMINERNIV